MKRRITALILASVMTFSVGGCGEKESSSKKFKGEDVKNNYLKEDDSVPALSDEAGAEMTTEPVTKHISPVETISAPSGSQVTVQKTIPYTTGSNTIKIPLADLIQDGDVVNSFTFVIYSDSGANIGEFKGGCGIAVSADCPYATSEGWYQSYDFSAPTQGTYGEIKWDVPVEIRNYISGGGELLFGYWWGNAPNIRIDSVICSYTRTRDVPVDGTASKDVNISTGYTEGANVISVPLKDIIPEGTIPEAVTYHISSGGSMRKFNGTFGISAGESYYQEKPDTAVFADSSATLTWFLSDEAKSYAAENAEIKLGYWWSEQPTITLDSVDVKYSIGDGTVIVPPAPAKNGEVPAAEPTSDFRSAKEIVDAINVGWNLGNTLDSYNAGASGLATETEWGNPVTTKDMIKSVKSAGFNAIRIPVTWGEHMEGNVINAEWLARVKTVVDYAYDEGMFVIINVHHDDYIWFTPNEGSYAMCSEKLKCIWKQLATEFADYGDRLLFEGMNEPRTINSANEWIGGTAEERAVVSKYRADFINTVRNCGGNNAYRTLIVTSYAASADSAALNDISIPANSGNIAVSVHYYAPWKFADGSETVFNDSGKSELLSKFTELNSKFISQGIPLIIGEFGCVNACSEQVRNDYYNYYISTAKSQGIKCFIWDNGVATGSDSYGIFNRSSLSWNTSLLESVMKAAK